MPRDRIATLAEQLARTQVFAALDAATREALAGAGVRRSLRRHQRLYRRGQRADNLTVVLSGRIDVVRVTTAGELVILRSLGRDAVIGLSTVAGAAHSADLVASEESIIFQVPGAALRALFARRPEVALSAVVHLAGMLAELSDELEALRVHDLEERLARRLQRIGRGKREVAITHAELAAHVGATRANVSRALARLEARGVLRRRRGRVELL